MGESLIIYEYSKKSQELLGNWNKNGLLQEEEEDVEHLLQPIRRRAWRVEWSFLTYITFFWTDSTYLVRLSILRPELANEGESQWLVKEPIYGESMRWAVSIQSRF